MRTSKELSGSSKTAKKYQKDDFQKRRQSWHTFFKVMVETKVVLGFSHASVAYGTNQRQWRLQRNRNQSQKRPKKGPTRWKGFFQRRWQPWRTYFKVFGETQCFQGAFWSWLNQSETLGFQRSLQECHKRPKKGQKGKKDDFQRSGSLDTLFS